ncbi:MAG: pyridoxine 5'-phosphate synthase [Candidatus Omnitrophica bacterium]|nr:pyridoxine 5'-phosphate synthase [Candidatus Omnitrophota bacterium]MDD5352562.1 pyridoxine 5'-phosphate synthase [Candidatus Omnitrophota bacterium]MDD5550160.1 pyridoxine 5'-phosphate synthase [Candidatus Omnitrophota bacterium]
MKLGVNIDHIASLRELRKSREPEPVIAAGICELAGADGIVVHLREDRRHIKDRDLSILTETVKTRLNLEMSINKEIVDIARKVAPDQATLVPERRQELTTEGGLDVVSLKSKIKEVVKKLHGEDILVSLFIEPDRKQIDASKDVGAEFIELHTGAYANSKDEKELLDNLAIIKDAASHAHKIGLGVNAGHGLDYKNVIAICKIPQLNELNIGYSIICRAVIVGLDKAVREMKRLIDLHSL